MRIRRREVLLGAAAAVAARGKDTDPFPVRDGVPRVDYHAHPEHGMTVGKALEISRSRQVKFGLVEHAGAKENPSQDRISNDRELLRWMKTLEGKPVFRGIQAEGMNWVTQFSRGAVARLDYVLADALTMPGKDGSLVKLWTPAFTADDPQNFMDRYVDFHLEVMAKQPLDILANPTFLPQMLERDYDRLWTERRMRKIVDAALQYGVAIEINSKYNVPRLNFLKMAKAAGLRFSFGSNAHTTDAIRDIDYGVEMYRRLELKQDRFFRPASAGRKPIERRTLA